MLKKIGMNSIQSKNDEIRKKRFFRIKEYMNVLT